MTRPRKQNYRSHELSDLTRQLLYSPSEKRAELVAYAEQLHDEIEQNKNYPVDFLVYRLTQRRIPTSESVMLVGEAIKPDLRLLIDALSRSVELPDEPHDPGMTTAELARSLGVSTKTIARWRDAGLRWRWGVRGSGTKPMVLITQSGLEAFQHKQAGRVASAQSFKRVSEAEQERLIGRARRLAQASNCPPQVILLHLAKRTGRSVETLRQLMHRHDQENPRRPVFGDRTGPLDEAQKQAIEQAHSKGVTISTLCDRFNKTRSTIYRAIYEGRANRALAIRLTAIHSPPFDRDDADEVLMHPVKRQGQARELAPGVIGSLPDALKPLYDRPIESDNVVRSLIVRYNFLKHRAIGLQHKLAQPPVKAMNLDRFEALLTRIGQARGEVIAATLPIALSVVRRQQPAVTPSSRSDLISLLGVAHRVLIDEIDVYDAAVAHTFESVLTNRLLRAMASPTSKLEGHNESTLISQLVEAGFRLKES